MGNPCSAEQAEDLNITRPPPCPVHPMMSSRHQCNHCDKCLKWKAEQEGRNMERRPPSHFEPLKDPRFQGPPPAHGMRPPMQNRRPPMQNQRPPMPHGQRPPMPMGGPMGSPQMGPGPMGGHPQMGHGPQMGNPQMGPGGHQMGHGPMGSPMQMPAAPMQMPPPMQNMPNPGHPMGSPMQMPMGGPAMMQRTQPVQMAPPMQMNPPMQPPAMHGGMQPQEPKVKVMEVMEPSAPPCQLGPMIEFEDDAEPEIVYEEELRRVQNAQPAQYEPKAMYEERREDPRQYREMMRR